MGDIKKAGLLHYLPFILMTALVFASASLLFWKIGIYGAIPVFVFFAIVQCAAMTAFALLPQRFKAVPRAVSRVLIGLTILVPAGILGRQNFQLEGFLFLVLGGLFGGPIIHFGVKTLGTLLTGRSWCSWGCWTAMVLDFLPYRKNVRWAASPLKYLRYLHFALSLSVVAVCVVAAGYSVRAAIGGTAVSWFIAGNILYYTSGIVLAVWMQDNRAFCKYLCPVSVLLKAGNLFSVVRIAAKNARCGGCKRCEESCPAGIAIRSYTMAGERVRSTECLMCMNCVAVCSEKNLKASFGADIVCAEKLNRVRKPQH